MKFLPTRIQEQVRRIGKPENLKMSDLPPRIQEIIRRQGGSGRDSDLATDPPVSEAQRRAMFAAKAGRSTLGIPKSVGEKFVGKGHDK